jgi:hypothetical protein
VSCGEISFSEDEMRDPRVGWDGKFGSEGDGSLAKGEADATGTGEGPFNP